MLVKASPQRNTKGFQSSAPQRAETLTVEPCNAHRSLPAPALRSKPRQLPRLPSLSAPAPSAHEILAELGNVVGDPSLAGTSRLEPDEETRLQGAFNQAVLDGLQAEFGVTDACTPGSGHAGKAAPASQTDLLESAFASLVASISAAATEAVATSIKDSAEHVVERVFRARDEIEYAAFCRIALARARFAKRPDMLKHAFEACMFGSAWPVTTNLAMLLSALHAASLRGKAGDPGVLAHLLNLTLERVPDDLRLETLVIYRSMFGADAQSKPAVDSYAQIKKRYANLGADAKPIRLLQWSMMDWWVDDIGKYAGHRQPMRIRAIEGLLAVLNPRLTCQGESCRRDCLVALLSRMLPVEGEGEQLEHWNACIDAWSACAASLPALTLAAVLCNVTRPNVAHDDRLWMNQFAVLIKALGACIARIDDANKRRALLGSMEHWFAFNVPAVVNLQAGHPQPALKISVLLVPLLRHLGTSFASRLELDLRNAVNPKDINANSSNTNALPSSGMAQATTG